MNADLKSIITDRRNGTTLIVLKGFSLETAGKPKVNLQVVFENKLAHLMQIANSDNQVISFDEFVCLYEMCVLQYRKILILENPLFWNLYPPDVDIPEEISRALLAHFDPDTVENDDTYYDLSDYLLVYSNYLLTDQGIACRYNISEFLLKSERIEILVINQPFAANLSNAVFDREKVYVNICNETDYFQLVTSIIHSDDVFAITGDNFVAGKNAVQRHIDFLRATFPSRVYEHENDTVLVEPLCTNPQIVGLLNKYWKYSSFREIKIYDLNEVKNHRKKITSISQERIISDLIEQVENCISGKSFRDVFVTAPTGSGKSLVFQLPAIYIAEKYDLVTIVVTPLIGLMNDQVQALAKRGYHGARTINSDISPVIKQEILQEVFEGNCSILYLSPESLLSRSDVDQLIGSRRIGMLIVDEAHIVTTWGKQFRPDYWYLGDHVQKLRRTQARREIEPSPFVIATFTATAIFEGHEDMYHETLNSLHMIDPITYLGYVKRGNISIDVKEVEVKKNKIEYEIDKFNALISMIKLALIRNQKTLIYFPTVALINRFFDYCYSQNLSNEVAKYHGQLDPSSKDEAFTNFLYGEKKVMLATKAFGMGIDIPDISIVSHFAPTGNVCDYMQEIGRAARDNNIKGHAIYQHMSNDFKHINRLHGLSAIQLYQLTEVIKKILELYINARYKKNNRRLTKSVNDLLVDAECFSYIFENPQSDENELLNKVKTAMLLIQKDFENVGFAPFYMRPIPMFAYGYFSLSEKDQKKLNSYFPNSIKLVFHPLNVCEVNLQLIWESSYHSTLSYPKFKYLLYSRSKDLDLNANYNFISAMSIDVYFIEQCDAIFAATIDAIKEITIRSAFQGKYFTVDEIVEDLILIIKVSRYKAENMINVLIAAMDTYRRYYSDRMNAHMYQIKITSTNKVSYQFATACRDFFAWVNKGYQHVIKNTINEKLFVVDKPDTKLCKEIVTLLGVLESFGLLRFKSLGGSSSQIYIHVNETKNMQMIRDKPTSYRNKLLESINSRHQESVRMLTFLFQSKLESDEIWEHLENYFLGILPKELTNCSSNEQLKLDEDIDLSVKFQIGDDLRRDYQNWDNASLLFDCPIISTFGANEIPLADYYSAKLIIGDSTAEVALVWEERKLALTSGDETEMFRLIAKKSGWTCIPINDVTIEEIKSVLGWVS